MQFPQFDLSEFANNEQSFAQKLGDGFRQFGFATITGHGISPEIIAQAQLQCQALFALPREEKLKYQQQNGGARGYTPFGVEIAKDAEFVDLKEFWHVGRELSSTDAAQQVYPQLLPNVWPQELPEFKPAMLALYDALEAVGQQLLAALALYLGQPRDYFVDKTNLGNSILRPLHYPPLSAEQSGSIRAAAHEDINLITLLVGSKEAGLEVQNQQGEWLPFTTLEGALIVNMGDMLQRLSNHVLPSTTHRVVNPTGEAAKHSRYSIPFFMHPNPDMSLAALETCISDSNPKREADILADEYLQQRLREIGLIK